MVSYKLFKSYVRPGWARHVEISDFVPGRYHSEQLRVANPRSVKGIVVPITTKGRGGAPKPYGRYTTGRKYKTDKGHLMGLEIGGPDISQNIAPQSNLWQQSGGWRKMEIAVRDLALEVMGWNSVADPAYLSQIEAPEYGLFFSVSPYPETDRRGEPQAYIGSVVGIHIFFNNTSMQWDYESDRSWSRGFTIEPGGFTWQ